MAKADLINGLKFRHLQMVLPGEIPPHLLGFLEMMWLTAWASHRILFATETDVEVAAMWVGEPGCFVRALVAVGFLDHTEDGYEIHDWWDHAPDYVKKRKDSLLLALERGYEIPAHWLKNRHLWPEKKPLGHQRGTSGAPAEHQQPTSGAPVGHQQPTSGAPLTPLVQSSPVQSSPVKAKKRGGDKRPTLRFTAPTVAEVLEYANSQGLTIDADVFVDHYQANGWHVGKTRMKDWKATVRNWVRREGSFGSRGSPKTDAGKHPDVPWTIEKTGVSTEDLTRFGGKNGNAPHELWDEFITAVLSWPPDHGLRFEPWLEER